MGKIQKIEMGSAQKRFDGNPEKHYHIRCTACDRIVDAHLLAKPDMEKAFSVLTDFTITGHRLEFVGLCPACRERCGVDTDSGESSLSSNRSCK